MTSDLDSTRPGPSERRHLRRYTVGFFLSMAAYLLVLFFGPSPQDLAGTPWQVPLALAPVVPVGFALATSVRFVRGLDEYQSRKILVALSIGFAVAMLTAVIVGFLDVVFEVPLPSWIIFVAGMTGWLAGAIATARR